MLTESELRNAFIATNACEPSEEEWPGLERFARHVEILVEKKFEYNRDKSWQEWMSLAAEAQRNSCFYMGLLDECAKHLGPEVYCSDDGSIQDSPIRIKIPELVEKISKQISESDPNGLSPHTPGAKLDANKPDCDLVFSSFSNALLEVAKVGTIGAKKYTDNGWESVPNGIRRYRSAIYRHMLSLKFLDDDSSLPHMAHAAWNCLAALELLLRVEDTSK